MLNNWVSFIFVFILQFLALDLNKIPLDTVRDFFTVQSRNDLEPYKLARRSLEDLISHGKFPQRRVVEMQHALDLDNRCDQKGPFWVKFTDLSTEKTVRFQEDQKFVGEQ